MENDSAGSAGTSVIHIGLHKAASTTLQHALYALRHELAAQKFLYPAGILPHARQHSDLAIFLRDAAGDKYGAAMNAVLTEFRKPGYENLLLSGEEFSSLVPGQIERLYADLAETGRQFRIALYIRNLYRIAISAVAEQSKSGKFVAYPPRVIARRRVDPSAILSRWEKVFGEKNVIAACLDALPPEINIVSHFADIAGVRLPREFRAIAKNRAVDSIASSLLSHLAYEFQVSHHFFYRSYFEMTTDKVALPKMEDQLLGMADRWVVGVDLSHPKLVPFRDLLCTRPIDLGGAGTNPVSAAGYLRLLGAILLKTAERMEGDERPKQRHRTPRREIE